MHKRRLPGLDAEVLLQEDTQTHHQASHLPQEIDQTAHYRSENSTGSNNRNSFEEEEEGKKESGKETERRQEI